MLSAIILSIFMLIVMMLAKPTKTRQKLTLALIRIYLSSGQTSFDKDFV